MVIARDRVLTCRHVVSSRDAELADAWLSFPAAASVPSSHRVRGRPLPHTRPDVDAVVLELDEPVPAAVGPARLRCVPAEQLRELTWRAFGFPSSSAGNGYETGGRIVAPAGYGRLQLACDAVPRIQAGFSGGALLVPELDAVVGMVVGTDAPIDGVALALHSIDLNLPQLRLRELARWSPGEAGEEAMSAWGWRLADDPEAGRHWRPRSGGGFYGRDTVLARIAAWLAGGDPAGRLLVVTGSPGTGKSAVLGRVVVSADPELRRRLSAGGAEPVVAEGAVGCAVHAAGKSPHELAWDIARGAAVALPDQPGELAVALARRLHDAGGRPFNLVVDALDEALDPAATVRRLLRPLVGAGVRLVVGTRRELLPEFGDDISVIDLDRPDYVVEADVRRYAAATLRDAGQAEAGAGRIAAAAGGNFLVAGLLARSQALAGAEGAVGAGPDTTVDAALAGYLERLPEIGRLALTVLAYAEPPGLTVPLWRAGVEALGGSVDDAGLAGLARDVADLLVETAGHPGAPSYRLFHQALGDALLHDRPDRVREERLLTAAWLAAAEAAGWSPAFEYVRRSLAGHARRTGTLDVLLRADRYLLRADLGSLLAGADGPAAQSERVRMVRRVAPLAEPDPDARAAMFSVAAVLDRLDTGFVPPRTAPYHARWADSATGRELLVLDGTAGATNALVAFPPGPLLAAAGDAGPIVVWDAVTGRMLRQLGKSDGHGALCAVPVPDGTLLVAAQDATVSAWDVDTGDIRWQRQEHDDWVRGLCTTRFGDRHLLVSAGDDGTAIVWDPVDGRPVRAGPAHRSWVTSLCRVGSDLVASGGPDDPVRLWRPGTGEVVQTLPDSTDVAHLTALAVAGRAAVVGVREERTVRTAGGRQQTDRSGTRLLRWYVGSDAAPEAVDLPGPVTALCAVGDRLVVAHERGTLAMRDALLEQRGVVELADPALALCAVPLAGPAVASGGDDGTVRLWPATPTGFGAAARTRDGADAGPTAGHCPMPALALVPTASGPRVAAAGTDRYLRLWHPKTGAPWVAPAGTALARPAGTAATSVCGYAGNGRRLVVTAHESGPMRVVDLDAGPGPDWLEQRLRPRIVRSLTVGDTEWVAAVGDTTIHLWRPDRRELRQVPHGLAGTPVAAAALDTGRIAVADEEGTLRLCDLAGRRREWTRPAHSGAVTALGALRVDGRWVIASAGPGPAIRLWRADTGDRVGELGGHTRTVNGLCAVGPWLASASDDRTVRLWDVSTGRLVRSIPVHRRALACVAAGDTLVVGLDSGVLVVTVRTP